MTQIKERPILFSASMVRAILEGRKTVTRRVMKLQPDADATITVESYNVAVTNRHGCQEAGPEIFGAWWRDGETGCKFPYGKPGDRLWVRETHADIGCRMTYRADTDDGAHCQVKRWTPAIHMFRRDSRILLEITDVRVERLQDISDEQAIAEGCFFTDYGRKCGHGGLGWRDATACEYPDTHHPQRDGWMWDKTTSHEQCLGAPRWAFANLWNSTGGNWDANPWVWSISFKQVAP